MIILQVCDDNICVVESMDNLYKDNNGIYRNKKKTENDLVGVWIPRIDYVNQFEIGTQLSLEMFI